MAENTQISSVPREWDGHAPSSRISVFGLGYVGSVSAACLSRDGHTVVGVDPNPAKVKLINSGTAPVIERGLSELIREQVSAGRLRATFDPEEAIANSEISLVCVGTPSCPNGSVNTDFLYCVSQEIGKALRSKQARHVVVVRSTIPPGTTEGTVIPALESSSGKKAGQDFGVCVNPEFLREGSGVSDYDHPPKTVIGSSDAQSGDRLQEIYSSVEAPLFRVPIRVGELIKYADNSWHALKVAFANEIGNVAKETGIDGHELMEIFCQDTKLNISTAYLKPGQAFGGSCLPKDVRSLVHQARALGIDAPILESILPSNRLQLERALQMIVNEGRRKVGILGFSFKVGTDDLRESPMIEIIERLIGKGFDLRVYDRDVQLAQLLGSNRDYLLQHIPHISKVMVERVEDVADHAETLVVGNSDPAFRSVCARLRPNQSMIDLVRLAPELRGCGNYAGLCW